MNGSGATVITHKRRGKILDDRTVSEILEMASGLDPKHVARVKASKGVTLNLGDFESLRIDAGVELPCRPTVEAISVAFKWATEWCDDQVQKQIDEFNEK